MTRPPTYETGKIPADAYHGIGDPTFDRSQTDGSANQTDPDNGDFVPAKFSHEGRSATGAVATTKTTNKVVRMPGTSERMMLCQSTVNRGRRHRRRAVLL